MPNAFGRWWSCLPVAVFAMLPTPGLNGAETTDVPVAPAAIDALFAQWDRPDSPGCALAVVRNGAVVYERGYGMADLEHAVPITPLTRFHVASVSKQFTVMAILLLKQEGRLSLDDDIRKYVPEMADFGKPILLRHLIHHTSGLRDQWELLQYAGWRYEDLILHRDVLTLLYGQRDLNFPPGERYSYCNSSYTLLGEVVARLSGKPLADFCRGRIFEPLGMKDTQFRSDSHDILPDRAYSYDPRRGGGFQHAIMSMALPGPTALQTTVRDLARWNSSFDTPTVGGKAVLEDMLRPGKLNDGTAQDYAGGLMLGRYRGLPTVSHTGVDAGYRAVFMRFPEQRFAVIILSNLGSMVPAALAKKVAELYLGGQMEPASRPASAPAAAPSAEDTSRYERYVGSYWSNEDRMAFVFVMDQGWLALKQGEARVALRETAPGAFVEDGYGTRYTFAAPMDGHVRELVRQRGTAAPSTARRIEAMSMKPADMERYVGRFRSPELDAVYHVRVQGESLMLRHRKDEQPLIQIGEDDFLTHFDEANRDYGDYVRIRFERDAAARAMGFSLDSGRVIKLRFERVEVSVSR